MDTLAVADAEWSAGLDLRERLSRWRLQGAPDLAGSFDEELADWRIEEWKGLFPGDASLFPRCVASLGVDEAQLRAILGVPPTLIREWPGGDPEWTGALHRILARPACALPWVGGENGQREILGVFSPFLTDARDRLREAASAIAAGGGGEAPFDPGTVDERFVHSLLTQLLAATSRVFTLELHVARLQGELTGEGPRARFESFVERQCRPGALAELLKGYPTLARMLVRITDQWVGANAEILAHLRADEAVLRVRFADGKPLGHLAEVHATGVSDPHRGGRSVAILEFSSGLKLVHKPRSLDVDAAFHDLVRWVEGISDGLTFRTAGTLCRDGYGWVEFVHGAPCAGEAEVELYYRRLGGLLAVLHVLDAQDMHMENVVAAGPHPVFVDLETLFHPTTDELIALDADTYGEPASPGGGPFEPPVVMAHSVFKVGLLPQRVWMDDEGEGVDVSGVGGVGNQLAPGRALHLEAGGSDEMRLERTEAFVGASNNQPRLADGAIAQSRYADLLDGGFTEVYRALASHAGELAADGVLAPFRDLSLRVVIRMTRTYASLLREGSHPDLLRDAADRDRFLDNLWLGVGARPELEKVVRFEQQALRRGDVPMFFATPAARDLVAEEGTLLPGFFRGSGMARVAERVRALGEADLARQRRFIRASMATLAANPLAPAAAGSGGTAVRIVQAPEEPAEPVDLSGTLVAMARAIGRHLGDTAMRGPRRAAWINLTTADGVHPVAGFTRYDLHGGLPGILLFLARLGEVAGAAEADALARPAFSMLRDFLHDGDVTLKDAGGFSGLGGVLVSLEGVRHRWPDLPTARLAEAVARRIGAVYGQQKECGLFRGAAGAAAGLLSYHAGTGSDAALDTALRCGDALLARAERADGRLAWPSPHPSTGARDGFAFGTAGVAWTLLRLGRASGEERFRASALEALDSAWRQREGASPDASWCHGAAGFALAMIEGLAGGESSLRGPLAAATAEMLEGTGGPGGHALCNGALGTLDVLLRTADATGDDGLRATVRVRTRALIAEAAREGWRCGAPLGFDPPGLMNGWAGIGYGLLRLAHPGRVPSILTLGL